MQNLQEAADTGPVNDIEKTAAAHQAMRWLSQQLAWEQALLELREGDVEADVPARAA